MITVLQFSDEDLLMCPQLPHLVDVGRRSEPLDDPASFISNRRGSGTSGTRRTVHDRWVAQTQEVPCLGLTYRSSRAVNRCETGAATHSRRPSLLERPVAC